MTGPYQPLTGAPYAPRITWDRIVPSIGPFVYAITATETLLPGYDFVKVDATAGVVTATLPPVAECYRRLTIKKTDVSANAVTVDGDGSETIDGAATTALAAQYDSVTLIPDPDAGVWWIECTGP